MDVVRQNAESFLNPQKNTVKPLNREIKYSRNQIVKVRYKDGTTVETKFKKIEQDLQDEKCFILN